MEAEKQWWELFPNFGKRSENNKIIFPAAGRNCGPILETLLQQIPKYYSESDHIQLLEIASGSGQHSSYFAPNFPNITFQPSEYSADLLPSIAGYAEECPTKNIKTPLQIDISEDLSINGFSEGQFDIIYCANMIHVAPYECTVGLFQNAGKYLKPNGILITYGAYKIDDEMAEGNVNFEKSLKEHDISWGIRSMDKLKILAEENKIIYTEMFHLPANNKLIIWKKTK